MVNSSLIHVAMYLHYALAVCCLKVQKYLRWKKKVHHHPSNGNINLYIVVVIHKQLSSTGSVYVWPGSGCEVLYSHLPLSALDAICSADSFSYLASSL